MEEILKPYLENSIFPNDVFILKKLYSLISEYAFFQNLLKAFPNLEHLSVNKILSNLKFSKFLADQIILRKGNKVNGIYIIFTGEILIYDEGQEKQKTNENKEFEKMDTKKYMFNNIYNINLIHKALLNPGEAIGLLPNTPDLMISRKIVKATKNSILGYINYNTYNRIIKELKSLDSGVVVPFLKSLNLFANINNYIEKLRLYTIFMRYPKDSYIFKEGEKYKTFYIIKKGIVNVSIKIKKTTKSLLHQDLLMGNKDKEKLSQIKGYELKGFYTEVFEYSLISLGKGEIVGDVEYYNKYPSYIYSVKCITPVELFEIDLNKFIYLAKKCGENLQKFHKKIKHKIEIFQKRMNNINITINKLKKDTDKRDIFTQSYLDNNTHKNNTSFEKYINNPKSPLGKNAKKYNEFKMNTNINNIVPNYLNILEEKTRNLSSKTSNKKSISFNYNLIDKIMKKKKINIKSKIFEKMKFNNLKDFFNKTKKYKRSNSVLMNNTNYFTKNENKISINNIKNINSRIEKYELDKINKDVNDLSFVNEEHKRDYIKVFSDHCLKGLVSREQALFFKKLNHKFLLEKRMNSKRKTCLEHSKSLFRLTNPYRSNSISYNHIY